MDKERTHILDSLEKRRPTERSQMQRHAWLLSLAGFAPFFVLCAGLFLLLPSHAYHGLLVDAMKSYGAVILSFLGGIRWGLSLRSADNEQSKRLLTFSVVPSLVGWFSLYLATPYVFGVQALAFAGQGAWDAISGERGEISPWFVKVRIVLTFLVTATMIGAFFATI